VKSTSALYPWIDATYVKVRNAGRIVSVAVIIAVGVNADGTREVLGMATGPSQAEPFWTDFLRGLTRRGLRGVKLVISDPAPRFESGDREGIQGDMATLPRHFMRNALAHAGNGHRQMVLALINTAFAHDDHAAARAQ
jgi:putative transposase